MRVYISGPITGVKDYKRKFQEVKEKLIKKGYEVINPAELDCVMIGKNFSYDEIMQICLELLSRCQAMAFLPGWEHSRGSNIEYGYALAKDIIILPAEELA